MKPNRLLRVVSGLRWVLFALTGFLLSSGTNRPGDGPRLIVRADDMGINRGTNAACMQVFRKGIARSVELIVPGPWFLEAVDLLRQEPGYDVGVHLVLTSEWSFLKWRPLTSCPSLTDSNGFFFPTVWKGQAPMPSLHDHQPDFREAEKELRAQILLAKKHLPSISHLSAHMGFSHSHPELKRIVAALSEEFKLPISDELGIAPWPESGNAASDNPQIREKALLEALGKMQKGMTYLLVTHPALAGEEMAGLSTPGYTNVSTDRDADRQVLTSTAVRQSIAERGIQVISVADHAGTLRKRK